MVKESSEGTPLSDLTNPKEEVRRPRIVHFDDENSLSGNVLKVGPGFLSVLLSHESEARLDERVKWIALRPRFGELLKTAEPESG